MCSKKIQARNGIPEKTGALDLYNLTLFKLRMHQHSLVTHIAVAENGHNFT
jgi:hypothetical protein